MSFRTFVSKGKLDRVLRKPKHLKWAQNMIYYIPMHKQKNKMVINTIQEWERRQCNGIAGAFWISRLKELFDKGYNIHVNANQFISNIQLDEYYRCVIYNVYKNSWRTKTLIIKTIILMMISNDQYLHHSQCVFLQVRIGFTIQLLQCKLTNYKTIANTSINNMIVLACIACCDCCMNE